MLGFGKEIPKSKPIRFFIIEKDNFAHFWLFSFNTNHDCYANVALYLQYGDFKIAENILHLVNNQGQVWYDMDF